MHFKVHSKYFYSKLDNSGKKVYEKILDGWLNYKESITISGFNGKVDYKDIFRYVYDDNPELFYIDFNRVSVMFAPFTSIVSMKMLYPKSRCEQIKQDIANVVLQVERLCKPGVDKERVVHDYLVQNVTYSTDLYAADAHNIKGALIDGSAVCEGYARAFKLLCDAVEVPCIMVSGTATDSNGTTEKHAWNIVRKNKNNYHVDVTWNCGINAVSGVPLYYNVPDDYISKDHIWQKNLWPNCLDSSEIDKHIIPVNGKKSLREALVKMSQIKKSVFAVRFNRKFESTRDVMNMIDAVMTTVPIIVASFSATYHPSLDCAIIWFNY